MADTAHRLTDEKLEEMEKRLSAIYSRAGKNILHKLKPKLTNCKKPITLQKGLRYTSLKINKASSRHKNVVSLHNCKERWLIAACALLNLM